jgi:flavin reductase (DIM6/NTAB) family NADH-FMN oxidoreductase RutF
MINSFSSELKNSPKWEFTKVNFMKTIIPGSVPTAEFHSYMLAAIAPRPIAFVSTMDAEGNPNLAPYSFFNAFGSNPPILIFSPARRVRDNTIKHTLENVQQLKEAVVNVVSYDMVQQMSLASTEYPRNINEFNKVGFTPIPSSIVKPFRVKESPVQFECVVKDIIYTGNEGGAGNLIVGEIVAIHIHDEILNEKGKIDQHKIDLVGRLGDNWYVRASGDALFEVEKPLTSLGIGVDALPLSVQHSEILTGNDLGILGNQEKLPDVEEAKIYISTLRDENEIKNNHPHQTAKEWIKHGRVKDALYYLIANTGN